MKLKDEERFQKWWSKIAPNLTNVARRIVGSQGSDIIQDVGVLAVRNWGRFSQYDDFARWCYIRTKWLALDELARIKRQQGYSPAEADTIAVSLEENLIQDLEPLIQELPDRQRQVVLDKLSGYATSKIATRMQISESSVRSHWRFAQQNLVRKIDN